MSLIRLPAQLLIFIICVSCATESDYAAPGYVFNQYNEDGISIAYSSGIPRYEEELFFYEEWYILSEDEREESLLVRPEPGTLDERGFLFVPDSSPSDWPSVSRICVYDSSGIFQYAFGQPGQGPGDMWHPDIHQIENGILETYDLVGGGRRLTRYRTDGSLVDIETLPRSATVFRASQFYRIPDGQYLLFRRSAGQYEDHITSTGHATAYSADWDSLWSVKTDEVARSIRYDLDLGRGVSRVSQAIQFAPNPRGMYHDRIGIILTTGLEPILDLFDLDGHHRLQIRIDLPPQPVTAEDRIPEETRLKEGMESSSGVLHRLYKAELENLTFSEYKAYWGETWSGTIEVDDHGFIWIRIPAYCESPGNGDNRIRYRIISPEGQYLGLTQLPAGSRRGMTKLTRGCLVVVEKDPETGEKTIRVYRVRPTFTINPVR